MRIASFLVFCVFATTLFGEEIPWNRKVLFKTPGYSEATEFAPTNGLKAIYIDGPEWKGKPTRIFAWYGAPTNVSKKVPAMVLVHGGGGTAFDYWVKLWNQRGYAAIAMDTCGAIPRGKYGAWERHAQGGPPGWGGLEQVDDPIPDQWTYHAVASVLLSHSLLRSFPEVDDKRIGITGISWGGYLTCISASVDDRFRFAVPVYGCGFLAEDSAWVPVLQKLPPEKSSKWLGLWDPSVYLPQAEMPFLWVNGTTDFAYHMPAWQKSSRLPEGPRTLCLRVNMPHAHGGAGENPEEIHQFANQFSKGGKPLAKITKSWKHGNSFFAKVESKRHIKRAEFNYTLDTGEWPKRKWQIAQGQYDSKSGVASGTIPAGATAYYMNVFDEQENAVSTEFSF